MGKIYRDDIDTYLLIDAQDIDEPPIDITGMDVFLEVWKPGQSTPVLWAGTINGTSKISYRTVEGDWDVSGDYKIQAKVQSASRLFRGATYLLTVYEHGT